MLKEFDLKWIGQTSINIANDEETLKLSKESGAVAFYIGFESLNEDFLRSVGKSINLKQQVKSYKEVIKKIHDNGICILGSFIYGTDFDTRDDLKRLWDFVAESNLDTAYVKPLTPFPGTEVYEELKKEGRLFKNDYWLDEPYPVFTFKPAKLSMDELIESAVEFVDLYNFPRSLRQFGKSLVSTKNIFGAGLTFLSNYGDYKKYKSYFKKNKENLENFGSE